MAQEIPDWLITAICILQDWQTLVASVVALAAALLTIRTIKQQIRVDKERNLDSQKSKAWAARAEMPDALSALGRYAEGCVAYLSDINNSNQLPDVPVEAISAIKSSVEYVDPQSAHKIYDLVVHYQIHNSRLEGRTERNTKYANDQRIYDSVYMRALVDRLFNFARNEVSTVPETEISRKEMLTALRVCVGLGKYFQNEGIFAGVIKMIEERFPNTERKQ